MPKVYRCIDSYIYKTQKKIWKWFLTARCNNTVSSVVGGILAVTGDRRLGILVVTLRMRGGS
jgi:hypothetical protein